MQKTQKPIIGGILCIVAGALNCLAIFGLLIAAIVVPGNTGILLLTIASGFLIVSIPSIIGGVFSLKRKQWGLALTGSILATIGNMLLGIPALILIVISKDEFE